MTMIKYGYLETTGNYEYHNNSIKYVEATCVCGSTKYYSLSRLKIGKTKSCGCKRGEFVSKARITHGFDKRGQRHPLYSTYQGMKRRCYEITNKRYENYGGRGITVCEEWKNDFVKFKDWAFSNGWSEGSGLSIERINNDDGYSPENCKWATNLEQGRNQQKTIRLTAFGISKCLTEWLLDERCNIGSNGLRKRLKKGWDIEKAITTKNMKLYGAVA